MFQRADHHHDQEQDHVLQEIHELTAQAGCQLVLFRPELRATGDVTIQHSLTKVLQTGRLRRLPGSKAWFVKFDIDNTHTQE